MIQHSDPLRPSRLLVVDDTAVGRATVEAALAREGHEIVHAESGPECLRLALEREPDLILLDVMMPKMDGFEVCRRLRSDPRTSGIPVVMVTALTDGDSMARGIEAGADDFIGKPFNKWELRARVSALVRLGGQQRALSQRDRFFWVFEHAADGFVLLDRMGEILNCNAAARRFLGFADGEPVHGDFLARLTRENVPYTAQGFERWGTPEGNDAPFHVARDVAGASYREWLQVVPHRDVNDPSGLMVVNLRDVTAQVERELRQFEFHEFVSHKLRTPLNGVVAVVDLLGFDAAQLPARDAELLDVLKQSAHRLTEAVVDILDYVDGGNAREAPLPVGRVAALAEATAEEERVSNIAVKMPPALAAMTVPIGETSMRVILRELIENARRFHPSGTPAVTVRVSEEHAGWVRIEVEDDGITLTPQQLDRALEPYVQSDPALTGEVPGMGLGLALVARRVRSAGGRCVIENRSDRAGVRVRMDLPSRAA